MELTMVRPAQFPALRPLAAAVTLTLLSALPALAQTTASAVGQVSMLIGAADVVHVGGAREPLRRGAAILVGDRLETSANGHVHVHFIDKAAVSVRPESVLEVQAYRYDAKNPAANEVRFNVENGTARSISGAATEVDKTRFRLNTPIAAIGVRGTDFIVQTDAAGVRATVSDGAIVVGALGGGCSAAGLGPCGANESRLLTAEMGRLMAEVRPGDHTARIVPAAGALLAAAAVSAEERVAARATAESAARAVGLLAAQPTAAELQRGNDRTAAEALTLGAGRLPDLNRPSNPNGQLMWGRWGFTRPEGDQVTETVSTARVGRDIMVAVGDDLAKTLGLFRTSDPANPRGLIPESMNAKFDFQLSRASAIYEVGGRSEVAVVENGKLTIDFGKRAFATVLDMSSDSGGKARLLMGGTVRDDGRFALTDAGQYVTGAVTLDGKEAGYLFTRDARGGLFRGITLWGR